MEDLGEVWDPFALLGGFVVGDVVDAWLALVECCESCAYGVVDVYE